MKKVWVVCGPTASGKTRLAIALAKIWNAEILSADSRQVFKELNIGVARPSEEELSAVPHHFIASESVLEDFSAGKFVAKARQFIETYFQTHSTLVICGGTGLYIRSLLEGMDRLPVSESIREEVNSLFAVDGLSALVFKLLKNDPELAAKTDLTNPRRVQRALEWVMAGKPAKQIEEWPHDWVVEKVAPEIQRDVLYLRINSRVDAMVADGLWNEALNLFPYRHLNALQTVGYQELFDVMEGKCNLDFAIDKIKQHSRNYAKRQLTWFKKDQEIRWLNLQNQAEITGDESFSQGS